MRKRSNASRAIVNRRHVRRRRRAIPAPRVVAWPLFSRLTRNLRHGSAILLLIFVLSRRIFAEKTGVVISRISWAAVAAFLYARAFAGTFIRQSLSMIAAVRRYWSLVWRHLRLRLDMVPALSRATEFLTVVVARTRVLALGCRERGFAVISAVRQVWLPVRRYLLISLIRIWVGANSQVVLPRFNLAPLYRGAAALLAIAAITILGLANWPETGDRGNEDSFPVISSRDHHPPLVDLIAARPTGTVIAASPDAESEFITLPRESDVQWLAALTPPVPDTVKYPDIAMPRAPSVPAGIPMRPEPPGGSVLAPPAWLANAVEPRQIGKGPMIAIVIDDAGVVQGRTRRASELPAPITIAFIPYSDNLEKQARYARSRGHELLLHIPMEPNGGAADPGYNALLTNLSQKEIMRRFRWALDRFDGYVGVNNHMGSKFMARGDLVKPVLEETNARGLLFLDSRTDHNTTGTRLARDMGMPNATRNIFLDNDLDAVKIRAQLAALEQVARRRGSAIAIGHPHDVTVEVLADWIPEARRKGFVLVPVSTIVKQEYGPRLAAVSAGGESEGLLGGAQ